MSLRCSNAIQSAFLMHPTYGANTGAIDAGAALVRSGKWEFAAYLPPDAAAEALRECFPQIVKTQQRTGLWQGRLGRGTSFSLLRSLKHASLLPSVLAELRYDPFAPFAGSPDFHGLVIRRDVMQAPLPDDPALQRQLIDGVRSSQDADGFSADRATARPWPCRRRWIGVTCVVLGPQPVPRVAGAKAAEGNLGRDRPEHVHQRRPWRGVRGRSRGDAGG